MYKIKKVLSAKFYIYHFFAWLVVLVALEVIIVTYLIPAGYLFVNGDDINFDIVSQSFLYKFIQFSVPFIAGFLFILWRFFVHLFEKKYSRAKSFLIILALFLVIFPFRYMLISFFSGLLHKVNDVV